MRNITILCQYFPPEMGAAATRWSEYGTLLAKRGFNVTVISELPNYPTGTVHPDYRTGRRLRKHPARLPLTVVRSWVWANTRDNTLKRLGFFFSFMISSLLLALKLPKPDLYLVTTPPLSVSVTGYILSKLRRTPLVLDIRDIWPESAVELGELTTRPLIRLALLLKHRIYTQTRAFTIAVPGFRSYLAECRESRGKPVIDLVNGVSRGFVELCSAVPRGPLPVSHLRVVYAGNIGLAQGLETVLEAARELGAGFEFKIIGDGARKSQMLALKDRLGLTNLEFLPPLEKQDLVRELRSAHIGLVPLINSPLFRKALPSKTFEYLAAGLYVICMFQGEIEPVIRASGAGICILSQDVQALVRVLRDSRSLDFRSIGVRGPQYIDRKFIKEELAGEALAALEKLR